MTKRYTLRLFRRGQTHSAPLAIWHDNDLQELQRIRALNVSANDDVAYCKIHDNKTGEEIR